MNKKAFIFLGIFVLLVLSVQETPPLQSALASQSIDVSSGQESQWAITYNGNTGSERLYDIKPTSDGGYVVIGKSYTFGMGQSDMWVLKLDSNGDINWEKTYGGEFFETGRYIQQTSDGGFIAVGGSVLSRSLIIKLDSAGNVTWQKDYGNGYEEVFSVLQTNDGGYFIAADARNGFGGVDLWVAKLNSSGNPVWQKRYGGVHDDVGHSALVTSDGGFVVVGHIESYSVDSPWIIRLDSSGDLIWQKSYTSSVGGRVISAIIETEDSGFVATGYYETTSGSGVGPDIWVLAIDSNGNISWSKAYGDQGFNTEYGYDVLQTPDGGYVVVGNANSYDSSAFDAIILRLDPSGNILWERELGGTDNEEATSLQLTMDGGYIVAGYTTPSQHGDTYAWVWKLDSNGQIADCSLVTSRSSSVINTNSSTVSASGNILNTSTIAGSTTFSTQNSMATTELICGTISQTFTISGHVRDSLNNSISGVTINFGFGSVTTNINGYYLITGLVDGAYELVPTHTNYLFIPETAIVVVGPNATQDFVGTSLCDDMSDDDGDGLPNGWEVCGYHHPGGGFVDLPAMGADPNHKDLFVEIDYMRESGECVPFVGCVFGHDHQPSLAAFDQMIEAFENSPLNNPDGENGIHLHIDNGPESVMNPVTGELWGNKSHSNALPDDLILGEIIPGDPPTYNWTEFDVLKANQRNFLPERLHIFHYNIFAHYLRGPQHSAAGVARTNGTDSITALGFLWDDTDFEQGRTTMHELGHNLGMYHGGHGDNTINKPNYLSVMNEVFIHGLIMWDSNAGMFTDGHMDYSRYQLPPLVENDLDETVGLNDNRITGVYATRYYCGGEDEVDDSVDRIDWNCNDNDNELSVAENINNHGILFDALNGSLDWDENTLNFRAGNHNYIGLPLNNKETTTISGFEEIELDISYEDSLLIPAFHKVVIDTDGGSNTNMVLEAGISVNYTITITNKGLYTDTYTVTTNSSQGWANLNAVPSTLELIPGESVQYVITVQVPERVSGVDDKATIYIVSNTNPLIHDTATLSTATNGRIYLPVILRN